MQIKIGKYQHYQGGYYRVIGVAKHSETKEELVVYKSLADGQIWVRPIEMFLQKINVDNKKILRFKYIVEK